MAKKIMENQEKKDDAARQEFLKRCIPIAQAIQKMIVEDDLEMGQLPGHKRTPDGRELPIADQDRPEKYRTAAKKILQMFLDHDLLYAEKELVFQLLKQPYDMLQDIVLTDSARILNETLNGMMGITHHGELSFKKLDELTKKYHPKMSEEAVAKANETSA